MHRRAFGKLLGGAALASALPLPALGQPAQPASVRFSVMLWTLARQHPTERAMELVAQAGYDSVELVDEYRKWSPAETARMQEKARALRLTFDAVAGIRAGFAEPGARQDLAAELKQVLPAVQNLEAQQIILLSGKRLDGLPPGAQHAAAIENLKAASDALAGAEVQLVIEPIDPIENPSTYLTSVTEAFAIVRAVHRPNVRVLYDFYHEQRAAGNLIEKLETNADQVALVHVADVPGRHEPGLGEIDYDNIYRKLAQLDYRKVVAMEFYPTGDPLTTLRTARLQAVQAFGSRLQR